MYFIQELNPSIAHIDLNNQMKRLAIITTHPIQYYAPLFRLLNERGLVKPKVFYTWWQAKEKVEDKGFGKTIQWDIPLLEGYEHQFIPTKGVGKKTFFGIDNPELLNEITKWNPDAILVYGWNFKSHLQVMRHFNGKVPVWFRGDSHLLDEKGNIKDSIRRLLLYWVYSHIDRAFYVGTHNKNYFLKHGLKEEQLVFAPHAIDNERFKDNKHHNYKEKALEWRNELGYEPDDIVILFAGKFEKKKDPLLLLQAVKNINHSLIKSFTSPRLNLLLVGNGPLENLLKEKGEDDIHIKFLPFQNQSVMPVLYRVGDLYCLPSKGPGETWGLAVNEALACSRPVLVSDKVGCAKDLVIEGKNGFIFTSGSIESLISKLQSFIKANHDLRAQSFAAVTDWNYQAIIEAIHQSFGIKS